MLRTLSAEEIEKGNERRAFLYQSQYTTDNLTAILMDGNKGGFGLNEDIARAKSFALINWLRNVTDIEVPDKLSQAPAPTSADGGRMLSEQKIRELADKVWNDEGWGPDPVGLAEGGLLLAGIRAGVDAVLQSRHPEAQVIAHPSQMSAAALEAGAIGESIDTQAAPVESAVPKALKLEPAKCPHRWNIKADNSTMEMVVSCDLCDWEYSRAAINAPSQEAANAQS